MFRFFQKHSIVPSRSLRSERVDHYPHSLHPNDVPYDNSSWPSTNLHEASDLEDDLYTSSDADSESHLSEVHSDDLVFNDPVVNESHSQAFEQNGEDSLESHYNGATFLSSLPQNVSSVSRTSSMEFLDPKSDTQVTTSTRFLTKRPRNRDEIGISPLYHLKDPSTRQHGSNFMDFVRRTGQYGESYDDDSVAEERVSETEPAWNPMPAHLEPFVPYIEKPTDETSASTLQRRPKNMQVNTIRQWLQTCEKQHGSRCLHDDHSSHPMTGLVRPLYLIDTVNICLVRTPADAKYVALSYVWGTGGDTACTTKLNIEALLQPEGLRRGTMPLPRTIIDAMHLVECLGERYLWVDRYCIVQDDSEAKQAQLAAMNNVYAGAHFTIVAAQNEDAASGLYGIRRKMLLQTTTTLLHDKASKNAQKSHITGDQIMLDQCIRLMRSKWYSRGWTFQEGRFSHRKVVFHDDSVNWECRGAAWHETQDMSVTISQTHSKSFNEDPHRWLTGFDTSPWPDMLRYARLVALFNERDLTYPEDVLDAFAGCLHHLSSVFPGGFVSGLPAMCFDAALLWQPWKPMTRRERRGVSDRDALLPSWSWAGWAGVLQSESWRSAASYQFSDEEGMDESQQCSWRTISTVKWYYSEELTSERQPINVARECAQLGPPSPTKDIPPGWSHVPAIDGQDSESSSQPDLFYHTCDPSQPFRYPIRICNPQGPPHPVVSARYLHCTTKRGFLKLGNIRPGRSSNCPAVELKTTFGRWAGILRLPCQHSDVHSLVERQHRGRVELIEISAGSVENCKFEKINFDEWNVPGTPRQKGLYEFVNVLWIEWTDGVAYRKALGRVKRSAWSRVRKERIAVALG